MSRIRTHNFKLVSGITFIRYVHIQKTGKPNNVKVFVSKKTNQEGNTMVKRTNTLYKNGRSSNMDPIKNRGEPMYTGRV